MNETANVLEEDMLAITEQSLRQWATKFHNLGVTVTSPALRRSGAADYYESEIEVCFKDENGIFDVLTFFVYRNGKAVASRAQAEAWVAEDLDDILVRRLANRSLNNS